MQWPCRVLVAQEPDDNKGTLFWVGFFIAEPKKDKRAELGYQGVAWPGRHPKTKCSRFRAEIQHPDFRWNCHGGGVGAAVPKAGSKTCELPDWYLATYWFLLGKKGTRYTL